MQKKLIALAVAGVLAAPVAAQAGVEVYGQVRLSVGFIGDDAASPADDSSLAVTSHASRLGFKGAEDLGDGLKAVYQVEAQVDMDDDNAGLITGTRNTFIGVAGGFGTVVAGRHDTPYKMSTSKLDVFSDTYGDYNAVISATHDARLDNVVAYISPDMSGFTLAVAYVSDIANDDLPDSSSTVDNDAVSIAGMYSNGPLYASLAFQRVSDFTGTAGEDADAMKLGVGYKLGQTDLGFVYENTEVSLTAPAAKTDQDAIYFSVAHPITADTNVKFAIGQLDESSSGAKDGGDFIAIGVAKNMTKNAELYALYSQMSNDTNGTNGLTAGSGPAAAAADKTASAFAVGMNLKFSSL
jgi:predicted porin